MRRDSRARGEPRHRSRSRPREHYRRDNGYGDRRRYGRSRERELTTRRREYHHRSRSRQRNRYMNHGSSRRQESSQYYNPRRSRSHSSSRMTHRHSRRMHKGGRSASTDHGHDVVCRSDSRTYKSKKDLSDDSAGHDDTVGSFEGVPGDYIDNRYKIIRDAGLGTFGRVVVCADRDRRDEIVALKVVRKVEKYSDSAKIEASILKDVNQRDVNNDSLCVTMHRWFEYRGHVVLVFETLGCSLYDYLKKQEYKPFPISSVRAYAWQLLKSLTYLESISLIHTDLKPENILLCNDSMRPEDETISPRSRRARRHLIPPASDRVKCMTVRPIKGLNALVVIDFGGATYEEDARNGIINTRQYRSPEVMLGLDWSFPSDIWSAGCIIAELYLGELLFSTHENLEHLALIERCIEPFPIELVERADKQARKYFDPQHKLRWPENASSQESIDHVRKMKPLEEIIAKEDAGLLSLLKGMLKMNPKHRLTARQALDHEFFRGISLSNLHGHV